MNAAALVLGLSLMQPQARLQDKNLVELSGVDASLEHPGIFYGHNDSGDSPRFFAFNQHGQSVAEYKVEGATARDWEDMSSGYCGPTSCLWFADIGDNGFNRKDYKIYEVQEPLSLKSSTLKSKAYSFQYQKGASHNAEAFAYNPMDGFWYIATKGENALYRLSKPLMNGMQANKMCDLGIKQDLVTGMDFSDGGKLLVRTYSQVHLFSGPCGKLEQSSRLQEPQGEAVAYFNGAKRDFLSISEGVNPLVNVFREVLICQDIKLLMQQHGCKL